MYCFCVVSFLKLAEYVCIFHELLWCISIGMICELLVVDEENLDLDFNQRKEGAKQANNQITISPSIPPARSLDLFISRSFFPFVKKTREEKKDRTREKMTKKKIQLLKTKITKGFFSSVLMWFDSFKTQNERFRLRKRDTCVKIYFRLNSLPSFSFSPFIFSSLFPFLFPPSFFLPPQCRGSES